MISGFKTSTDPFGWNFTGISSTSGKNDGEGGDINLQATKIEMTNRAQITSNSKGSDKGGGIQIKADNLILLNGSNVSASAFGTDDRREVKANAHNIRVSGVHPELYLHSATNEGTLSPSSKASQAGLKGGNGGNLNITTGVLEVLDGGILATDTFGAGKAGNINIATDLCR